MEPYGKLNVWRPVRFPRENPGPEERRENVLYGRSRRANPELLSVYNPPLSSGAKMYVRRTASNLPITINHKGRRYTWQALVVKFGIKRAARIWGRAAKIHGREWIKELGPYHPRKHAKKRRSHTKKRRSHTKKRRSHTKKRRSQSHTKKRQGQSHAKKRRSGLRRSDRER